MAFSYKSVVPWGRSFEEYQKMFNLGKNELDRKILGCGDGPASFNYKMYKLGKKAISLDPIYQFTKSQIEERINETYEEVLGQTRYNTDKFIWTTIPSVDELGKLRMSAMKDFLIDFETGKKEGRYIYGELPVLPFEDRSFDLALCSHFLFLYTENLSLQLHIEAIKEMCRVAKEVRIFPILDVNSVRSAYVDPVKEEFIGLGKSVYEEKVDYEFQKGGNMMLKIY